MPAKLLSVSIDTEYLRGQSLSVCVWRGLEEGQSFVFFGNRVRMSDDKSPQQKTILTENFHISGNYLGKVVEVYVFFHLPTYINCLIKFHKLIIRLSKKEDVTSGLFLRNHTDYSLTTL